MPERATPGPVSDPTLRRGAIVGKYPSNTEHDGLHWGQIGVGVFWGFVASLILAVLVNWFVNRNARCDLSNWVDDYEDEL